MSDAKIREILATAKTIAVVGLSSNPERPSYSVTEYMQRHGYKIIPVNPRETEVLGEPAVATLQEVSGPVDIVNIFRRPAHVPEVVEQAIAKGVRCIWMQQGIEHAEAARRAEEAGLFVVMDRCIYREHRRLSI
jgi:predicted CoA-binding protein